MEKTSPIDNLKGSEKNQTELWLDLEREEAFHRQIRFLSNLYDHDSTGKAFQQWVADAFNTIYHLKDDQKVELEDVASLIFGYGESPSATEIAGQPIQRPILMFNNEEQYFGFLKKILGKEDRSQVALYLPLNEHQKTYFADSNIRDLVTAGAIFGKPGADKDHLGHEVRHSIDPDVKKRVGFDGLISELFAYAYDYLDKPNELKELLNHDTYFFSFLHQESLIDQKLKEKGYNNPRFGTLQKDRDWYQKTVGMIVDKCVGAMLSGKTEAQRLIVQKKRLEEFFI